MVIIWGYGAQFQEPHAYYLGAMAYSSASGTASVAPTFTGPAIPIPVSNRQFEIRARNRNFIIHAKARRVRRPEER